MAEGGTEMQALAGKGHVAIGRGDIDGVRQDRYAVADGLDGHLGVFGQQGGEQTAVFGGQMLDNDVGHTGFGGQPRQDSL